jgi:hypothetical protein
MIKGAQKSMIVVKTQDSYVFEEAYFVIRRGAEKEKADMVREANRIIEKSGGRKKDGFKAPVAIAVCLSCFLGGGAIGGAITALVGFLI